MVFLRSPRSDGREWRRRIPSLPSSSSCLPMLFLLHLSPHRSARSWAHRWRRRAGRGVPRGRRRGGSESMVFKQNSELTSRPLSSATKYYTATSECKSAKRWTDGRESNTVQVAFISSSCRAACNCRFYKQQLQASLQLLLLMPPFSKLTRHSTTTHVAWS